MQIQKINLDFSQNYYRDIVVKQNDKDSRSVIITVTDNGTKFKLDSSIHMCNIRMLTPDGREIYNDATILSDGTVQIDFTEQMVLASGTGDLEIEIIDSEKSISTMHLNVVIIAKVYPDDDIVASDEFNALTAALLKVQGGTGDGGSTIVPDGVTYIDFDDSEETDIIPIEQLNGITLYHTEDNKLMATWENDGTQEVQLNGSSGDSGFNEIYGETFISLGRREDTIVGDKSVALGSNTTASGTGSHAEGSWSTASGNYSHAEGESTNASGNYSHVEGRNTTASKQSSHAEGENTTASGNYSHAEGYYSQATASYSHAEGYSTIASQYGAHAEGDDTNATGQAAHAEGNNTEASGSYSHAEGSSTKATQGQAHAEGLSTVASGYNAHAEGQSTEAEGNQSHAEGNYTKAIGQQSHAEGIYTVANGDQSHAEGAYTIASGQHQHVQGMYNTEDTENKYAHIVGGGTGISKRKNIHTLDWDGNAIFAGDVTDGNGDSIASVKALIQSSNGGTGVVVPTKVSELENDVGYITIEDLPKDIVTFPNVIYESASATTKSSGYGAITKEKYPYFIIYSYMDTYSKVYFSQSVEDHSLDNYITLNNYIYIDINNINGKLEGSNLSDIVGRIVSGLNKGGFIDSNTGATNVNLDGGGSHVYTNFDLLSVKPTITLTYHIISDEAINYGTSGQYMITNGDGTIGFADGAGSCTDEQIQTAVESYLSENPIEPVVDYSPTVKAVNHRGYSAGAPENTLPAYILSKKKGFEYAECDVAFTSDGVAVLLHDDTIDRTSNGSGNISNLTYNQLLGYDFGSWFSNDYIGTKIPTFEEFIKLCKHIDLHPYIELKSSGNYTREQIVSIVNMVKSMGMKGKVTYISFNSDFLGYVKDADATARLGYLSSTANDSVLTTVTSLRTGSNEVYAGINYTSLTNEFISNCIVANIPLEIWTVNDAEYIKNMNDYISGVTSDSLIATDILRSEYIDSVGTIGFPTNENGTANHGIAGQFLVSNGDGTISWASIEIAEGGAF